MPKGTLTKQPEWKSQIFPDTVRDWWVYVPAQYKADGPPAAVMVFQDGGGYINAPVHVPIVFDNLIHRGDMPVTVGVFVNPGDVPQDGQRNRQASNRSFEYDTLSDQYVRFLLEEILPAAEKQANVKLRTDPASRAIGGRSQRRHLLLDGRVGTARPVRQGLVGDRQLPRTSAAATAIPA